MTHFDVYGAPGQASMLMLHGGGSRARCWEHVAPRLTDRYRVFAPDLRGFGRTIRPSLPELSYSVWVQDIMAFADRLSLIPVSLVGWSMGGLIAMQIAALYPEAVRAIVLMGVPDPARRPSDRSGFLRRLELAESGASPETIVAETFEFTKAAFSPETQKHRPQAVEAIRQEHLHNDPVSYAEMVRANLERPSIDTSRIAAPTCIQVGDADKRTPIEDAYSLTTKIPDALAKVVRNCGHYYTYEQPEEVARITQLFLSAFDPV